MTYAIWIDELRKDDIALAGGKGANLGELSRAGLPVPPGFVVTTGAYDAFVEAGRLRDEILALASRAEDPIAFGSAAEKIRALFARTAIPENLAEEIRAAYGTLADKDGAAVAARSSATAEDLPGASFAGQQETYLNVRGEAALLEAVRGCWASLWTARGNGLPAEPEDRPRVRQPGGSGAADGRIGSGGDTLHSRSRKRPARQDHHKRCVGAGRGGGRRAGGAGHSGGG